MTKKNIQARKERRRRYQIEVTSMTLFLWGFCLLFFVAWIFVLGLLVGKGFLPGADSAIVDLKSQVSKLQDMMARSKQPDQEAKKREAIEEKLGFYEKLESKKDEEKRKEQVAFNVKEGSVQKSNDPGEAAKADFPKKQDDTKLYSKKPGKGIVQSVPPAGKGLYTLQIASLENRDKAENTVKGLMKRGYDAYFYKVNVKGKLYYRVSCGRFMTRKEAGDHASKMFKETGLRGFVRRIE
jgi:cell division septation protein DedD